MASREGDTAEEVGIFVDFDPAVWLPGPAEGVLERWIEPAYAACLSDFDIEEGGAESDYLREVLTAFAAADVGGDLRFLLLRNLVDLPLVARISAFCGAGPEVAEHFADLDPQTRYYDDDARIEVLDAQRGLRRGVAFEVAADGIRSVIRYHRRVEEWDVDYVLACAGVDLNSTAIGLELLDALAMSVWFLDLEGTRR